MIKIAIIGAGGIARAHINAYLKFREICQITALCDIYPEKAEKYKQEFNLNVNIYNSYIELIEKEKPDAVSLCVPPFIHREISIYALDSGVHVFCEKPMAPSVEDCNAMLAAQEQSGKLLGICHQNRFRNDIREVKSIIDSGILGKLLYTRIDSFWWRSLDYYTLWWRGTWEKEGGGCILNHAVHHLDLMLWFLGKSETLYSLCSNLAHKNSEVEDFGTVILRYADKSIAQFTGSVMNHGEDQQMLFQCEKGKISSPWSLYCSKAANTGFPTGRDESLENRINSIREELETLSFENHPGAVCNFLLAITGDDELLVDGEAGKDVVELISLIYQSSQEKRELPATINSQSPWYSSESIIENAPRYYKKTTSLENIDGDIIVGKSELKGENHEC